MPGTASADSTEEGSAGKTEEKPKASSENTGYLDSDMEFLDDEPLFSEKSESSLPLGQKLLQPPLWTTKKPKISNGGQDLNYDSEPSALPGSPGGPQGV